MYGLDEWYTCSLSFRPSVLCVLFARGMFVLADYDRAIEYHIEHLKIALALRDRVGEGRAYWSLGNANASQGNMEKALQYAVKHLEISREVGRTSRSGEK